MQFFSIVAHYGDDRPKTCAMLQDATLEAAAEKASSVIRARHLDFVRRGSTFTIRRSSRRETAMLQSYLHACSGANLHHYTADEVESLLFRRNSLLLSFFMGLYLDFDKMRSKFSPFPGDTPSTTASPKPGSGSGGVEMSGAEDIVEDQGEIAVPDVDGASMQDGELFGGDDDAINDDNQIAAMSMILAGASSGDEGSGDSIIDLD